MGINLVEIFDDENRLDKKSREFLLKAIEKNNLPGFDYLEFKQALIRLKDLDMDAVTSIRTAFATASTVGLTRATLLESAQYYLSILKNEFDQFNGALENQLESKVHSREKQKASVKKKISTLESKITAMQEDLKALTEKLNSLDSEAEEAKTRIDATGQRFSKTLESITQRIETDIKQIKDNLPKD